MAIVSETIRRLGNPGKEVRKEQYFYGLIMKNVLVTGADGQLGSEIKNLVEVMNLPFNFHFTDAGLLDVTSLNQLEDYIVSNNILYIINCAAYTAVDRAETEIDKAYEVNVTGTGNIATIAKKNKIKVIHISTDFVFDGKSDKPYTENMEVNPLSVYGETKLKGEYALKAMELDWIIIRTSWLYSEFGNNFVKSMIRLLNDKDNLSVVVDEIGSPTYAADLAEMIIYILQFSEENEWKTGLYHFCNKGEVSRFGFAKEIKRIINDKKCEVIPVTAKEYGSSVKRPAYSALDTSKISNAFGVEIPRWEDSLKRCIKKIYT